MPALRRYASWLRRTPLHPQWLMPKRSVWSEIKRCKGRVLDIGAADGWLATQLDGAADYISLDYPATAITLYGTKPHVFADACNMPFADASVDAIACYEVMEHVRHPNGLLSEVARILAVGGVAEFTMPFFYPVHDAPHDYQRWTRHGWARSLEQAGLVQEAIEPRGKPMHAAGVAACMALAGPLQRAGMARLALGLPVLLLLMPAANLMAWILGRIWPSWDAMPIGYRVLARKRG